MRILGLYAVVSLNLFSFLSTPAQEISSISEEQQCQFPHMVEGERPEIFWAQELVGADLLREELKKQGGFTFEDVAGMIGIWDSSVDTHGEFVSNLIAGPKASAVIPLDEPLDYNSVQVDTPDNYIQSYRGFYRECHQKGNCPTYINNSMYWNSSAIADTVAIMSSRGSTMITGSGNDGRAVYSEKNKTAENQRAIVVAGLDMVGYPSNFTRYSSGVTISAPADYLRSYNFTGEADTFGGASGATPLVTGALGGFSLLSNYFLGTHEARHLLTETAIPIPTLPKSHLVGAGMLNAYKMGRIALRLKERCKQYPLGFSSRYECISDALRTQSVYNFAEESLLLTNEAVEAFPECSSVAEEEDNAPPHAPQCNKTESFNTLRKAAFLDSQNKKAWEVLACVKTKYFDQGYDYLLYQKLAQRVGKKNEEILREICQYQFPENLREQYKHSMQIPAELWRIKFLSESSLMGLLEQKDCRPGILAFMAEEHIHPSSNYIQNMDELLEKMLRHPNTDRQLLGDLSLKIAQNINRINNSSMVLDTFFSHPLISGGHIYDLILELQAEFVVDSIPNIQTFVEQILTHPERDWGEPWCFGLFYWREL